MPKSVASSKSSPRNDELRRSSSTATTDSERSGYMGNTGNGRDTSRSNNSNNNNKSNVNTSNNSGVNDSQRRPVNKGLADVPRGSYLSAPETCFRSFCVFNPTLSRGKEERAMDNIIYFFPPETSQNAQMNHVGFCIAVTCVSERFSTKAMTQTEIRTDNRTITIYSPAKDVWMAIETDGKYDSSVCVGLMKKICRASITRLGRPIVRAALSLSNESIVGGSLGIFADSKVGAGRTKGRNKEEQGSANRRSSGNADQKKRNSKKGSAKKQNSAAVENGAGRGSASSSAAQNSNSSSSSFNQFVCLAALMAFFDDVAVFLLNTVMVLDLRSTRTPTLRPIRPPVPQKTTATNPLSSFDGRHGATDVNTLDDGPSSPLGQTGSVFSGDGGSDRLSPSSRTANSSMSGVNFQSADGPLSPLHGVGNGSNRPGAIAGYRRDRTVSSRVFDHRMESSVEAALRRRWTVLGSSEALLGYAVSLRLTAPSQHTVVTSIIAQYLSLISSNAPTSSSSSSPLTKKRYTDLGGVGGGGAAGLNFDYNYTCNHAGGEYNDEDEEEEDDEDEDEESGDDRGGHLTNSRHDSRIYPESNEFKDAISFESLRTDADVLSQNGEFSPRSDKPASQVPQKNDSSFSSPRGEGEARLPTRSSHAAKKTNSVFQRAAAHTRWAGIRYAALEAKSLQVLTTNISPETLSIVLFLFLVDASISETPIFLGNDTKPHFIYVCCAPTVLLFLIVDEDLRQASHNAISALSSQLAYEISDYLTTGTCTLLRGTVLLRGSISAASLRSENPYVRSAWAFHCGDPVTSLALGGSWSRALGMLELFGRAAWTGLPLAPSRASLMQRQRGNSYSGGNSFDSFPQNADLSGKSRRGRASSSYAVAASASYASSLFGIATSEASIGATPGQSFVDSKYATFLSSQALPEFSALYSGGNYTSSGGGSSRRVYNYGDAADGWGGVRGDPPPFGYTLVASSYMRANNAMRNARWMVVTDTTHFGTQILSLPRLIHWAIAGMVRVMQHDDEKDTHESSHDGSDEDEDEEEDGGSSPSGDGFNVMEYWLPFHGMTWLHMSKTESSTVTCSLFSDECTLQECFDAAVRINDVCAFGAADAMSRIQHRS